MAVLRSILFVGIAFFVIYVILVIAGIRPSIEIKRQDTTNIPFVERIDGPVRLTVVAAEAAAFHTAVSEIATSGIITQSTDPADLGAADAVVFLVNSWDEVGDAPWQDALSRDYERVIGMAEDSFALSSTTVSGSRPMQLTFYNLSHHEDWTIECYAELFLHRLTEPEDASFAPSPDCPI